MTTTQGLDRSSAGNAAGQARSRIKRHPCSCRCRCNWRLRSATPGQKHRRLERETLYVHVNRSRRGRLACRSATMLRPSPPSPPRLLATAAASHPIHARAPTSLRRRRRARRTRLPSCRRCRCAVAPLTKPSRIHGGSPIRPSSATRAASRRRRRRRCRLLARCRQAGLASLCQPLKRTSRSSIRHRKRRSFS